METITEPGVYTDLPAEVYHAQDEWLSWSRMKNLIPPSTPAHFKAAMEAPQERKRHFDLGKIVHKLVLGEGEAFEVVQALDRKKEPYDATDYKTVSAQEHRDAIYERGNVPVLAAELADANAMAAAVKAHPIGAALFTSGKPEVSLFWVDETTGVKCRARLDWLPDAVEGRRLIVPDLKTAVTAAPAEFSKAGAKFGYYGQATHYSDGIKALGIDADPAFLFVVVEKAAPWLVSVGQFTERDDRRLARAVVDHCRRLYAECTATDTWPGYGESVASLSLPMWHHYDLTEVLS
ncbi:MAG TPA: PD-(D/E)XK nuclease-like domain-containing protein [Candidatus Limnocylindrales bacterium]